jgi:hypothetical protein
MPFPYDKSPTAAVGRVVVLAVVGTFVGYACVSMSQYLESEGGWLRASIPLLGYAAVVGSMVALGRKRPEHIGRGIYLLGAVWLLCCLFPYYLLSEKAGAWLTPYLFLFLTAMTCVAARYVRLILRDRENALAYGILGTLLMCVGAISYCLCCLLLLCLRHPVVISVRNDYPWQTCLTPPPEEYPARPTSIPIEPSG